MSEIEREKLTKQLTPKMTKFIPHTPYPKQAAFLSLNCREAFYGGAAGGGKSDALLMAALQYVDVPGYSAILFRRTFAELTLPEALMDRAADWLQPYRVTKEVHWSSHAKTYTFKSGAKLTFGYLDNANDHLRYQSAAFHFVGFDELTHFEEYDYVYLFSRVRILKDMKDIGVPLRTRATSNPGGPGHLWVKKRFIDDGLAKGRIYIPAIIDDNPALDKASYVESLSELHPLEKAQLLEGDWTKTSGGKVFKREWFEILDTLPETTNSYTPRVRYWDLAATDADVGKTYGYKPAYTVGLRMAKYKDAFKNDFFVIEDVKRFQKHPDGVEAEILKTALEDGRNVDIWMEEEPGSSGKNTINAYTKLLRGYSFRGARETGSKVLRANRVSSTAGQKKIKLLKGMWNDPFLDEVDFFPDDKIKDQIDCLSGSFDKLSHFASYSVIPIAVGAETQSYWQGQGV